MEDDIKKTASFSNKVDMKSCPIYDKLKVRLLGSSFGRPVRIMSLLWGGGLCSFV